MATLEIAEESLKHGMMLKDATAFNMQYVDGRMQLIDTLSFCKYEPGMPWFAFQQFLQHFLNPMLLMTNCGPGIIRIARHQRHSFKTYGPIIAVVSTSIF